MRLLTILMLSVFCAIAPAQRGERIERPRERGERMERPERPQRAERGERQLPPRVEMRLRWMRARMEQMRERLHELRQRERGGQTPRHDRATERRRGPQGQRGPGRGRDVGARGGERRRPPARRRGGESTDV